MAYYCSWIQNQIILRLHVFEWNIFVKILQIMQFVLLLVKIKLQTHSLSIWILELVS